MRVRGVLAASAVAALAASASMLAAAAPASADQIWYQSISRASASAACPNSSQADLDAGWSPWSSSWEQWSNGGKCGYVCSRSITWAYDEPAQVGACTEIDPAEFVFLAPSGFFPGGMNIYDDALCASFVGTAENELGFAFTVGGQLAADAICAAGNPTVDPAPPAYELVTHVYVCGAEPPR